MSFRNDLKSLLRERGLSQREFASRCGKSPAWASRILKGSLVLKSLDEVLRICEILECSEEEATQLCQVYRESKRDSSYEIILRTQRPESEADLLVIDSRIDAESWKSQGRPTVKGEFAVVGRGARHGLTLENFQQFNHLLAHLFEKGSVTLEDLARLESDSAPGSGDEDPDAAGDSA